MTNKTILAFDLYGTLLSTHSIATTLAKHYGQDMAESIATLWRRYQIEYTFRLNSMKQYQDFEEVTRKSLLHTLAEYRLSMEINDIEEVMQAYDNLSTFKDVVPALEELRNLDNVECVVFSNGTKKMITNSVNGSSQLSDCSNVFSQLVSIDHIRSFKPAPEVYKYLAHCVRMAGRESEVWLVSGNPFDVVGARSVGLNAAWVDRSSQGWQDRLGPEPTKIIHGLGELVDIFKQ
ncbi:hypothetical protein LTS08_004484 [Lithohypha guttulata]|nr:hypothetical protein LTS08_004484 [Lithohypha guttulata]